MDLCEKELCTGCGACINICNKGAISFVEERLNGYKAVIDSAKCTNCGLCQKICPSISLPEWHISEKCYAGWSLNADTRRKSASGGIASEVYRFCEKNQYWFVGCKMSEKHRAILSIHDEKYELFQNSKYVYSDAGMIYTIIENKLKSGNTVIFIGLPCQVSGLKNYLKTRNVSQKKLVNIDLICHGVIPGALFVEYLHEKEEKYHTDVTKVFFRDPQFGTDNFYLTLSNSRGLFYESAARRHDEYQLAYHRGIAYRDNCYSCQYAKKERIGDLTLADFVSVGTHKPVSYDKRKVSCILVNSAKGQKFINKIQDAGYIFLDERPIDEEYDREKQLVRPTVVSKERKRYLFHMKKGKSFCLAIRKACRIRIIKNEVRYIIYTIKQRII